ncbi:hypothetical protein, partial [Cellulosimicrobium sp. I38E]|uniref:hypothetical protein n=1 Tax=Cellulosimicrobium sp. I38E TaxID=1393139 RepID=UPI000A63A069
GEKSDAHLFLRLVVASRVLARVPGVDGGADLRGTASPSTLVNPAPWVTARVLGTLVVGVPEDRDGP